MASVLQYTEWGFYLGIVLIVWAIVTYFFWVRIMGRTDRKWVKASKIGFIAGIIILIVSITYLYLII